MQFPDKDAAINLTIPVHGSVPNVDNCASIEHQDLPRHAVSKTDLDVEASHVGVAEKLQLPLVIGRPYEAKSTDVKIPPTHDNVKNEGQLVTFGA